MDVFWNTIAAYNAATWPVQLLLVAVAAVLTLLLYLRPTRAVRVAMKVFMAALNFWIAGVYYFIYCAPREHYDILALFWAVMGCIWIYDLAAGHDSLGRTGRHPRFALPCSVAVFTVALMLAFSERANIVLATFLCHWALIGFSKVYFFGIPEDFLLACSVVPALFLFFRRYIRNRACESTKPSPRVLNALLAVLCAVIGVFFTFTFLHQFDLFTEI